MTEHWSDELAGTYDKIEKLRSEKDKLEKENEQLLEEVEILRPERDVYKERADKASVIVDYLRMLPREKIGEELYNLVTDFLTEDSTQ